jgi:hypothetical protein
VDPQAVMPLTVLPVPVPVPALASLPEFDGLWGDFDVGHFSSDRTESSAGSFLLVVEVGSDGDMLGGSPGVSILAKS